MWSVVAEVYLIFRQPEKELLMAAIFPPYPIPK
jgi:hypothetical protein